MDTVKHMIRFPSDVYARLRKIAETEERSINWTVVAAVKRFVEEYEAKHGCICQLKKEPVDNRKGNHFALPGQTLTVEKGTI